MTIFLPSSLLPMSSSARRTCNQEGHHFTTKYSQKIIFDSNLQDYLSIANAKSKITVILANVVLDVI